MIIRIRKIHLLVVVTVIICISFVMAVRAEPKTTFTSSSGGINLPVVMYHHVTEKESRAGRYVIKTSELKSDLDYIAKCGYTTVDVQDLIDFSNGKIDLPDKIIMITFDDGFQSVYKLAWPLLKEKKMKAVLSPVGVITELYTQNGDTNINYAYMTWDELREINMSDEFEVQNHSYDMHHSEKGERKGISRLNGESEKEYTEKLTADLTKMQTLLKNNSGITATAAVYPYGSYSSSTLSIVKSLGFKCTMLCEERINVIKKGNKDCLFNLGRFNRPSGKSSEAFFEKLLK
ncbi:MAG: polysaccharide deacetylase family protein [Faecalibacterium sp.]|nr:polysaccharide deacetylase family protein [Ruminococcus sp.]MCM1391642.1 polysaccharide deacetylase family protein [Ruminococcus sp.]MCM1485749.1 polysaccharide deacetylase family protein [Faecalibacterium sp.]